MLMTQASTGHKARCPDQGAAIDDLFYQSSSAPLPRPSMREKREDISRLNLVRALQTIRKGNIESFYSQNIIAQLE